MSGKTLIEECGHDADCEGIVTSLDCDPPVYDVMDGTCTCGADQDGKYEIGCC